MLSVTKDWNPKQARLKEIILKPAFFDDALALSLELHSFVHQTMPAGTPAPTEAAETPTFADEVFSDVSDDCFRNVAYEKGRTFAYNVWHITRIEDICANILIAGGEQVINADGWIERLKCAVTDTGNTLSESEIADFSQKLDKAGLFEYRLEVGKRTRRILQSLEPGDMKRKAEPDRLRRILDEKAVAPGAVWLIDFWGKKNVAGLIQMPLTRHQLVHLNECLKIKKGGK